jgi:hypothetical protein
MAGKRVPIKQGETLTVGRTDKANVAFPHDDRMSRLHFSIECSARGIRVVDRGSANGTVLNGLKVTDTLVANGDEIRAGNTEFVVRVIPDAQLGAVDSASRVPAPSGPFTSDITHGSKTPSPSGPTVKPVGAPAPQPAAPMQAGAPHAAVPQAQPAASAAPRPQAASAQSVTPPAPPAPARAPGAPLTIGSWVINRVPAGWEVQEGFGMQQVVKDAFPASVVASEEILPGSLQQYVEAQVNMLRQYLREPLIEPALPPKIPGAEDTVAIEVRYTTKERQAIYYRRVYAKVGERVATLTMTSLEGDLPRAKPVFDDVMTGVALSPKAEVTH